MSAKAKHDGAGHRGPARTCVSCRKSETPAQLIRWVRGPDDQVVPDLSSRQFGRGAWAHATPECMKGLSRALAKSFRGPVSSSDEQLLRLLEQAAEHRTSQLLGAARRQGLLACGGTPVSEAVASGRAQLLIVAKDAQAAAKLPSVIKMIQGGKARVWGSKAELGRLGGRGEIGVLAVLDHRLAQRLFGAIAMAPRGPRAAELPATHPTGNSRFLTEVE